MLQRSIGVESLGVDRTVGIRTVSGIPFVGHDEPAVVGDYVISHAGYAIHKIDVESAKEKLAALQELIDNEIY